MSTYSEERPGTGYYRPPGSSHGAATSHGTASPEQSAFPQGQINAASLHSPYQQPETLQPPTSSHGFPSQAGSQPVTPVSGSLYPAQTPNSAGQYYGLAGQPGEISSPPPTTRPNSQNFTPEGNPIVPVGISGGKMFRCRGFGDCDKVFTRSEHLARHVRKHTGERPFPCHCGKAFSRLDNLRQHSATVHADQQAANESMLSALAPVHAALSSRAGKDQRRRGEVVEVPKNAVERPRHNEGFQKGVRGSPATSQLAEAPYAASYPPPPQAQWSGSVPMPPQGRPRTGGGYDYPYAPDGFQPVPEEGGPSRRPGSSSGYQQPMFYPEAARPPTSDAQDGSVGQYGYRPVSGNERDMTQGHYSESDPPHSAHGPPQQHLYQWQQQHGHFPPEHGYPQNGDFQYADQSQYGHPPPGSANYYQAQQQYYPNHYAPPQSQPGQPGYQPVPYQQPTAPGQDSPFQYNAPNSSYGYDSNALKRRSDEVDDGSRKQGRPGTNGNGGGGPGGQQQDNTDALWLPPTTERRSSLAISALLGSPQPHSKTPPGDQQPYIPVQGASYPPQPYPSAEAQAAALNGHGHGDAEVKKDGEMEVKAKALLAQHAH